MSSISYLAGMSIDMALRAWEEDKDLTEMEQEETKAQALSSMNEIGIWLSNSFHLQSICIDDQFLTTYLKSCKFSLEKIEETSENLQDAHTCTPEWLRNIDAGDTDLQETLKTGICMVLPSVNIDGGITTIDISGSIRASDLAFNDLMRSTIMVKTIAKKNNKNALIEGFITIQNMEKIKSKHLTLFNLAVIKKLLTMGETKWPARSSQDHILNKQCILQSISNIVTDLQQDIPEKGNPYQQEENENYEDQK